MSVIYEFLLSKLGNNKLSLCEAAIAHELHLCEGTNSQIYREKDIPPRIFHQIKRVKGELDTDQYFISSEPIYQGLPTINISKINDKLGYLLLKLTRVVGTRKLLGYCFVEWWFVNIRDRY